MLAAVAGLLLLIIGVAGRRWDPQSRRNFVISVEGFSVPVTRLEQPGATRAGDAVIVHGLSANRGLMMSLGRALARNGFAVYLLDVSGHGDNTDPFTFATAEQSTAATIGDLAARGEIHPERAVLVGHSMGGDIVIRLADRVPFAATVAISPGPLVPMPPILDRVRPYELPGQLPRNLLVISGGVDLPLFDWAAHQLIATQGGARETPEDFAAGTARSARTLPWATHTGLVFRKEMAPMIRSWFLHDSSGISPFVEAGPIEWTRPALPLGVILLFPAVATLCAAGCAPKREPIAAPVSIASPFRFLKSWAASAILIALVLHWVSPLGFLRIATGNYLAAFLLCHAIVFLVLQRGPGQVGNAFSFALRTALPMAGAVGVGMILAIGWAVSGEWGDLWMNGARWWRFLLLAPLLLPYFVVEESLLGERGAAWSGSATVRRWLAYFTRRGIIWLAMLAALLFLHGSEILVLVMGLVFLGFSLAQRAAGDTIRQRFGNAEAAAVFDAILAAWFLAAVFPLM